MSKELIIKAYELLEQKRPFGSLNSDEKIWVNRVFGTEQDYERMLSLSNIALEEEDILAPSMTVESVLLKTFDHKHSRPQKNENKSFSLISFLSKPLFKIALPSLIVLMGVTWFLNKQMPFEENVAVAQTEKQAEDRNTSSNEKKKNFETDMYRSPSLTEQQENLSGSESANGQMKDDYLPANSNNDIVLEMTKDDKLRATIEYEESSENEVVENLVRTSESDALYDLRIREAEDLKNEKIIEDPIVLDLAQGDNAAYAPQNNLASVTAPTANHNDFTWQDSSVTSLGTFTVQDASNDMINKVVSPVPIKDENKMIDESIGNYYSADDQIGNSKIEVIALDKESRFSNEKGYKAEKFVSSSSSAVHDKNLFEFLYTTY